ncbi:unnamed protein product [Rotaria socialis]|uniref:DUF8206 domain-containing protein n=1 Tax=Rotaria socialis TaxID=392032 RepID=A0A818LL88_9BILA|nr:unnamed protein product [Rotaria socialis]
MLTSNYIAKNMNNTAKPNELCRIKANRNSDPSNDINVLLLGLTGVGKSTFINALANYLCNDTLEEACKDKIQAVIPSAFSFTDDDTFEQKTIEIGQRNEHEDCNDEDRSCTQRCRSFIFRVGDKNLRIIDTPSVGDTRGPEQDVKNFHDIFTYISQYEHLNGICILLKPNEERLTILFRFCINELLRHLHKSAHQNIIFVFTNARATFFKPGVTSKILRALLDQHKKDHDVDVSFSRENTFLLDNESFRYLALRKNGVRLNNDQTLSYQKSWDHTIKEYSNLINHIVARPLHAVSNTLSLNEAEQLVRKLTRPIAEIAKLIQENIQLAREFRKTTIQNSQIFNQGLPQNEVKIVPLAHPRLVCTNKKCCRPIIVNNETVTEYITICHEPCYLKGIVEETIKDPRIKQCEVINYITGKCLKCDCLWSEHQHITYEYETNIVRLNGSCSLADIDKRISDLRDEQTKIEDIYKKLAKFLHANSMLPLNDDILEYLSCFIRQEQMKKDSGSQNNDIIQGLKEMMKSYEQEMKLFKRTIGSEKDRSSSKDVLKSDEIFSLVRTLYDLPINGKKIREQVEVLIFNQKKLISKQEVLVELPAKADSSALMRQFKNIMSSN